MRGSDSPWLTMPRRWSGALSIDRKTADRLGQSAFDLFASPLRTVFLSEPLR